MNHHVARVAGMRVRCGARGRVHYWHWLPAMAPVTTHHALATGTRGQRGHGWYVNYRAGKGGRHLQGEYFDRGELEEQTHWNASILQLGSQRVYLDICVEPKNAGLDNTRQTTRNLSRRRV
jgi:hypothetical protein